MFCKAGALELSKLFENLEKEYPGRLFLRGIGLDLIGYDEFKQNGFFSNHPVYIDVGKKIYKALKYKKPGLLSCFGMCTSNIIKRKKDVEVKYNNTKFGIEIDFKKDLFQMGGSFMINFIGKILLEHVDRFYGDHVKEKDITEAISNYFEDN